MNKLIKHLLLLSLILSPTHSFANGNSGHGPLIELISLLYGFDEDVSKQQASFNLGYDQVLLLSATNPLINFGGRAAEALHFKKTIRNEKSTMGNFFKKLFNRGFSESLKIIENEIQKDSAGLEVPAYGNAGSLDGLTQGLKNNEYKKFIVNMHTAMDLSGAHQGFMASLRIFSFRLFGHLFSLVNIPDGHFHEGTNPDRISFEKFKGNLHILGGPLIAARERQIKSGGAGINFEWLSYLKDQGVDVNDPDSMFEWIINNEKVLKYFKNLNSSSSQEFQIELLKATKKTLVSICSDKIAASHFIDSFLNEISETSENTPFEVMYKLIDELWKANLLNEKFILGQINKPISTAETLNDLVSPKAELKSINLERGDPIVGTRKYVISDIISRYFNNYVRFPWNYHQSDYLNKIEGLKEEIEVKAIDNVRFELFGINSKFVEEPSSEYKAKVYAQFIKQVKEKKLGIGDLKFVILELCDAILNTSITTDGSRIYTFTLQDYVDVLRVGIVEIWGRNNKTPEGNWDFVFSESLPKALEKIQDEYGEQEFIPTDLLQKWNDRRDVLNDKYNNPETPTGFIQKTAAFLKASLEKKATHSKGSINSCKDLY